MAEDTLDFLKSSDWHMGVLFAMFVAVILIFDKVVERLEHYLKDDPTKKGLRHALHRFKAELLAVGVVSLLLTAFTDDLTRCRHKHSNSQVHADTAAAAVADAHSTVHSPAAASPTTSEAHSATPPAAAATTAVEQGHHLLRHLMSTGGCPTEACDRLFTPVQIHNAHLLLFMIAVVNICYGVITLVIGMWQVHTFKHRPRQFKCCGRVADLSWEETEANATGPLPLDDPRWDTVSRKSASVIYRFIWAIRQHFRMLFHLQVIPQDLYRATRFCAYQYLNTVRYKVTYGKIKVIPAAAHDDTPAITPAPASSTATTADATSTKDVTKVTVSTRDQGKQAGGQGVAAHKGKQQQRCVKLHHTMDFAFLAQLAVQSSFSKETKSEWLLPLMMACLFLLPKTMWVLCAMVTVECLLNIAVGIKLQILLLHMAIRCHRYVRIYNRWSRALQYALKIHHASKSKAASPDATATPSANSTGTDTEHVAVGPIAATSTGKHVASPSEIQKFYWGKERDVQKLFWRDTPHVVRAAVQTSYFINSVVLALLLFVKWQGSYFFGEKRNFWIYAGVLTAVNTLYLSFVIMPTFALICTPGRHVPPEVIEATVSHASIGRLYRQITHRNFLARKHGHAAKQDE